MLTCKVLPVLVMVSIIEVIPTLKLNCEDLEGDFHEKFDNNPDDIQTIVDQHNLYRQAIMDGTVPGQPRGIGLKQLKWDVQLAEKAQDMADTCDFMLRSPSDSRFRLGLGQNIASYRRRNYIPNAANWTAVVETWFNDYKQYQYKKHMPNSKNSGSYTQIVWADTEYIGCGFNSHDTPNEDSQYPIEETYICLYGPRGNQLWKYPYTKVKASTNAEEQAIEDY